MKGKVINRTIELLIGVKDDKVNVYLNEQKYLK